MILVLVESPTKARKLSGYLDRKYVVRASVGHIRDLPKSKMGVDVEHGFVPEYLVPKDKSKVVKELQLLAKDADTVILATDPDREGEAIGWHLQELLIAKVSKATKFVRSTFHEITEKAVLAAINNPTELNMALVDAQQARRILDRLVGYTVSPVLWKKIRYGLSAGRVQSVALRLIVDREREIEAFKPEEYWELDVLLNTQMSALPVEQSIENWKSGKAEDVPEGMLVARAIEVDGKSYEPKQANDVLPLLTALPNSQFAISQVDRKERRRSAIPPFTTSTLQQNAATRLGYTSKNTMRLAQQLYEEGLITYHRTDSLNLSTQAMDDARGYITKTYGGQYIPDKPNFYATKSKNAQEAHEAIRPTSASATPERIRSTINAKLTEQHLKLYDLIWRRFLASQMAQAVYDQTTILVRCTLKKDAASTVANLPTTMTLKANGSVLKFDGWMRLFPNQGDVILPDVTPSQQLQYTDHLDAQKFTQPPPRFNDASLIKTLESEGIGRPSTYASIISVIEDRGYVDRREKRFYPTPIGMAVTDFLQQHFESIVDYKFTANMEDDLDAIARGEKEWQKIIADFYTPLNKRVSEVVETADRAQIPVEKTGEPCPKCGETEQGEIVIRAGKFGKFKSCSRFPACDFTENIVNKVDGVRCPLCQDGDVVIKPTRFGRDFYSCTRYPECSWASWKKPAPGETLTADQWKIMQDEREAKRKEREASGKTNPRFAAKSKFAKKAPVKAKKTTATKSTEKKKPAAKVTSRAVKKTTKPAAKKASTP